MENLAGVTGCDPKIIRELLAAGIELIEHLATLQSEVPTRYIGQLKLNGEVKFTFQRAWYYWVVNGDVPLEVARELYYEVPFGKEDIRVAGHCGCPPPEEWAFPKNEVLVELSVYKLPSKEYPHGDGPTYGELAKMCNSGQIQAPRFVGTYHIDTLYGLVKFVAILRKHNLVD